MGRIAGRVLPSLAVALSIVAFAGAPARAAQGALDGKTFVGESGEKGKAKGDADEIVFANGTFRSKSCDAYGFTAAPYTTTQKDGVVSFTAHGKSPKEGAMQWTGTVKGDALEGTAVWTKAGQADIHYWVNGKLKK